MIIMVQEKCLDPQMKVKIFLEGKMRTEMKKNVPLTIRIPTSANYPIKAYQSVQGSNIQSVRSKPRQAHVPWPSSHTLYIDMYPPFYLWDESHRFEVLLYFHLVSEQVSGPLDVASTSSQRGRLRLFPVTRQQQEVAALHPGPISPPAMFLFRCWQAPTV